MTPAAGRASGIIAELPSDFRGAARTAHQKETHMPSQTTQSAMVAVAAANLAGLGLSMTAHDPAEAA